MKTLSIDVETFSRVALPSCGVYKYVEDEEFEILIFGYSADGGEIHSVDLACGEEIPEEILAAIWDPSVEKRAWNANFERTTLGKYFGKYCPPEQWFDPMIMAACCGLPATLEGAGSALGLSEEQAKMKIGKQLIREFSLPCKPTKKNGMRTRNLPEHDPENWELYKEYNRGDVRAEMAITERLLRWRPSRSEHKLWCLDQRINDLGIGVDTELALNAIGIGDRYKERLMNQAIGISGVENPNSVSQVKMWLQEQEGLTVPSLNKKVIADLVAGLPDGKAKEFMNLRAEFSKSSTKKYEAIARSVCEDQHIRGCFQFTGAGRTGRWCLTGDHEVLTPTGWVRLDEWQGGPIAVWNTCGQYSFQPSRSLSFDYEGEMYKINSARCQQISTPDHSMPVVDPRGRVSKTALSEVFGKRFAVSITGRRSVSVPTASDEIRILIMVQADGHYTESGDLRLKFRRERKIERCRALLRRAGILYVERNNTDGTTQFDVRRRDLPIYLRSFRSKEFGWWLLDENPSIILEELELWDGTRAGPNSIQYSTCSRHNADVIQAVAVLAGCCASVKKRERGNDSWSEAYMVDIWLTPGGKSEIRREKQTVVAGYSGKVYCAETPTGFFLVRREGKTWITGNSGRLVQLQNLPQNHMADLDSARQLVKSNDEETFNILYTDVAKTLSELIRTSLVPEEGHRFIVADYSAIEARVVAWIAGEEWRLKVFEEGGDIYCASASQMFKVPVEKHGQNSHLRQKGKIAELALGYGGGVNALKAFGADKTMTEEEMVQTVDLWRESSPHICALWKSLEKAAIRCVVRKEPVMSTVGSILFEYENGVLWMSLPSGRRIAYWGAEYSESGKRVGKTLSYMGVNQASRKWERIETWGGKLVENLVQATARDCLKSAMLALQKEGYDIRAHIHDEVVITEPVDGRSVEDVCEIMGRPLEWAPGLPLRGDGYATPYYKKD